MRIRNFALIRELEIEFGPGLNLLTGETGSGKSIIVDALGLLLGERASQEMVRGGSEQADLEAVFSAESAPEIVKVLEEAGISCEDDQIIVRREISAASRNRIFINNTLTSVALLKALGDRLADIHGQHDHQSLIHSGSHLDFLDRYGNNAEAVREAERSYLSLREIAGRLQSMEMDEKERLKRIDILQYQVDEIRRTQPKPEEREELETEKRVLSNRERIHELATELYGLLYESEASILGQLSRVVKSIQELAHYDPRWEGQHESLAELKYRLEDLAYSARDYTAGIDFTPDRLEQVEQRLAELERLTRKYGHSLDEVLKYADECARELDGLLSHTDRVRALENELDKGRSSYLGLAGRLSEKRRKDARGLEKEIKRELQTLSMEKTEFAVNFRALEPAVGEGRIPGHWGPSGLDHIEFLVAPNKGEELKPLARIASGGELSRIVLALKTICGGDDPGRILVFDEVDAGIGGRVAEAVGRRLREISRANQVLCVTHLPQIAAFATYHYVVLKKVVGARSETSVVRLGDGERVEELARMVGGETITETTRRHAREMLAHSNSMARQRS